MGRAKAPRFNFWSGFAGKIFLHFALPMRIRLSQSQSKIVPMTGLGPVVLRRNRRARRLTLRISPGKPVTLTLPFFISEKAAIAFLEANREWALQKINTIKTYHPPVIALDTNRPITTRSHRLELQKVDDDEIKVSVHSGIIRVRYPEKESITNTRVQNSIAHGLLAAYRIEANQYLPGRVRELAEQFGFHYRRVFIKNLKSRWGSCSAVNNINLNLHLMRLPDELIDYVILHELIHTRVKNHSPVFWQELGKILPDTKLLRHQIKIRTKSGLLDSVLVGL